MGINSFSQYISPVWPQGVSKIFWITARQTTWWQNCWDLEHFTAPWRGIIWPGSQLRNNDLKVGFSLLRVSCGYIPCPCFVVLSTWSRHWINHSIKHLQLILLLLVADCSALHHWWAGCDGLTHLTPGHTIITHSITHAGLGLGGVSPACSDQRTQYSIVCMRPWENFYELDITGYIDNIYADCSACYDNINSPCPDRSVPRGARLGHVTRACSLVTRPCTRTGSTERTTGGRRKSDSALFKIASGIRRGDNCVKFLFLEQKLWYRLSRLILVLFLAKGESRTHKKPMIRFALLSPSFSSFFCPKPPSTCIKVPRSVPWDA